MSSGEVAATVVIDTVYRLIDGVISSESLEEESYSGGLLEYPQYTRPADYQGDRVPEVLLSGDHARIREWRVAMALKRTKERRPDLYAAHTFTEEEKKVLRKLEMGKIRDGDWEEEE